jgi:hypothetical protein
MATKQSGSKDQHDMLNRLVLALIITVFAVSVVGSAAFADEGGGSGTTTATCGPLATTCTVSVSTSGSNGSGGRSVTCSWRPIIPWPPGTEGLPIAAYGQPSPTNTPFNVHDYLVTCSSSYDFLAVVYPSAPGQAGQQAASELALAPPRISTSPAPPIPAVINLPSYLYVDPAAWQTFTATATIGGITATAVATPNHIVWSISDGNSVTCDGPGISYDSSWGATPPPVSTGACTYTFAYPDQPGNYSISATVYYHVTWTSAGVSGGGDLGILPGPTATVPVTVDQIRSIITSG